MDKKILELEKNFFKYEYISNKEYLNSIIDNNYEELGSSGRILNKDDVINELSNLKNDRDIIIYNYTCREIDKNIWLVHYITQNGNTNFYRTSIWKKDEDNLKILFHQASEYRIHKLSPEIIKAIEDVEKGIGLSKVYTDVEEMLKDLDKMD